MLHALYIVVLRCAKSTHLQHFLCCCIYFTAEEALLCLIACMGVEKTGYTHMSIEIMV